MLLWSKVSSEQATRGCNLLCDMSDWHQREIYTIGNYFLISQTETRTKLTFLDQLWHFSLTNIAFHINKILAYQMHLHKEIVVGICTKHLHVSSFYFIIFSGNQMQSTEIKIAPETMYMGATQMKGQEAKWSNPQILNSSIQTWEYV